MTFNVTKVMQRVFGMDINVDIHRAATIGSPEWKEFDKGMISENEMIEKIAEKLNCDLSKSQQLMAMIKDEWAVDPEMKQHLDSLTANEVNLYALTNMPLPIQKHLEQKYPEFWLCFKGVVVSAREGLAKPESAIYQLLLKRYELTARESCFFDDMEANILSARDLGITARLFVNETVFKADLDLLLTTRLIDDSLDYSPSL